MPYALHRLMISWKNRDLITEFPRVETTSLAVKSSGFRLRGPLLKSRIFIFLTTAFPHWTLRPTQNLGLR